jgi:protein SCO1/2
MTSNPEPRTGSAKPAATRTQAARRAWMFGPAAAVAAAAGVVAAGKGSASLSGGQQHGGSRLPDAPLLTHEGKTVRFYTDLVRGRIVFINMMYTDCSNRCPPMTQNLKRVHEMFGERAGRDIFIYSITLQPEFDRPADLRAYMDLNKIERPGWTFLTGSRTSVEQVRRSLGFFDRDPGVDGDLAQHTGMIRVGNDALDRWCMAAAILEPELIYETLMAIDPVARAAGRTRTA